MNFYAVSALVNLITGACLCLAILSKEKRNKIDLYFALFAFSACIWSVGYFFWQISHSYFSALYWSRFLIAGAIGIGITYLHFVFEFLGISTSRKNLLRFFDITFATLLLLDFTPLMVRSVEERLTFSYWPVPGFAFHIYLIVWVGGIFYSTKLLYDRYKIAKGLYRRQIQTLFWAVSIGFIAGSFNYFLWYKIPVAPITNILVSLYFILVFYAIVRYRFFNIKVVATEAFVLLLIAATIWQLYLPSTSKSIWLLLGIVLLVTITGIFLIRSVIREVTQREEMQNLTKKLEDANEQLKALDTARAEFISIASHQLRTPPATLKWYLAAVLAGDFGPITEQIKKAVANAQMTNNGLISLIDDLLNASRIERGKLEFIFEPTDLVKLSKTLVDQMTPLAMQRKHTLVFVEPKSAIPEITMDKEKIRQVINNFIDNAIKYTPNGGRIEVSITKTAKEVVLRVKDNGRGISKEGMSGVFEKYNRGNSKDSQGLGLGLFVAKVVVEEHNGRIWAESQGLNKGSTFAFSLPLKSNLKAATYDLAANKK